MKRRTPTSKTAPPGQRQLRVSERIRHLLAEVMREETFRDPALESSHMITVTAVEIGPDLAHATAYVMPLGGKDQEPIVAALNRAAGFFRTQISKKLELRHAPKVSFKIDHSFAQVEKVEKLLRQEAVQRDLAKQQQDDEELDQD